MRRQSMLFLPQPVFFPAADLESRHERPELGRGERVHGAIDRPGEASLLQALRAKPESGTVPGQQLEAALRLVAEGEHVARERILAELGAHQLVKPFITKPQIGWSRPHKDLGRGPDAQHWLSSRISAAAQIGETDAEIRTGPALLSISAPQTPSTIAGNSINGVVSRIGTASRPQRQSVPTFIPLFSDYSDALNPVRLHFSTILSRSPRLVYRFATTSWQSSLLSIRTAYPPRAISPRLCSSYRLRSFFSQSSVKVDAEPGLAPWPTVSGNPSTG